MVYTYTKTETWSYTTARYVAGKVAADLRQLQQEYGEPTDYYLQQFRLELTVLLAGGYLKYVSYGYQRNGQNVLALRYEADMNGNLIDDDRSGRVPRGVNTDNATFYSFLEFNDKWFRLSSNEKKLIEEELPFTRSEGIAPTVNNGTWQYDKTYSSVGCGLHRAIVGGYR